MFGLFKMKEHPRKSVEDWKLTLAEKPAWLLENIVKNPGEFVIEMRQAASQILENKKAQ